MSRVPMASLPVLVVGTVPPGRSGTTLTDQAVGFWAPPRLATSNPALVDVR